MFYGWPARSRPSADFYNAAFIDDVRTALSDPEMARYGRRYLIGFSLGGHVSLWAALKLEQCIAGVVAICPPLDLKQCQTVLDSPTINAYRSHCLKGLKRTVRAAKKRADNLGYELNVDLDCLNQIKTIYQWDDLVSHPDSAIGMRLIIMNDVPLGPT